jgi:hypothetical protein
VFLLKAGGVATPGVFLRFISAKPLVSLRRNGL